MLSMALVLVSNVITNNTNTWDSVYSALILTKSLQELHSFHLLYVKRHQMAAVTQIKSTDLDH